MPILSEVIQCIKDMSDDVIIMADDFAHLGAKISTIYNALSNIAMEGKLQRAAKGVYVKSWNAPSVDDIVRRSDMLLFLTRLQAWER